MPQNVPVCFCLARNQEPRSCRAAIAVGPNAMNKSKTIPRFQIRALSAAAALLLVSSLWARGQNFEHLRITQPGGMPGMPTNTSFTVLSNGYALTWDGPAGYYQIFQSPSPSGPWQALGK